MERMDVENMVDYWHIQEVSSKKALDYATEQRRYWVNKLVTAQVTVVEIADNGEPTE